MGVLGVILGDVGQPRVALRQVRVPGVIDLLGRRARGLGEIRAGDDDAALARAVQDVELGVQGLGGH